MRQNELAGQWGCGSCHQTFPTREAINAHPCAINQKAAPSKAARELTEDIEKYFGLTNCTKPVRHMIAKRIDNFMANLLEKAKTMHCVHGGDAPSHGCACNNCDLAKALEPWKAE